MSAYPPEYLTRFDLRQAIESGDLPSATEIASELANASESINQLIGFVRALATVDRKFRPNTFVGTLESEEVQYVATAAQTNFDFSAQLTVDPLTSTVHVYTAITGSEQIHLIDPTLVTLNAGSVDIPARTADDIVLVQLFDGAESLLNKLGSAVAGLGASLITIEDVAGLIGADNVEGALAENRGALNSFISAVGALGTILRADGSVSWTDHHNAGNKRLTNLAAAVNDMDAVNLKQVNAILGDISDISSKFLKITGGSMRGNINMLKTYRMSNLAKPKSPCDAVRLMDLDEAVEGKLSTIGLKDTPAAGTITGPVTLGADYSSGDPVADADQTTEPDDVVIHTISGVPHPGAPDHVTPADYVDAADAALAVRLNTVETSLGEAVVDPAGCSIDIGGAADLSVGGEFNFDASAIQTSPIAVGGDLIVFADGDLTINGVITMNTTGARLYLRCSGILTLNANITGSALEVILEGNSVILDADIDTGNRGSIKIVDIAGLTPNSGTLSSGTITRTGGPILLGTSGVTFDASKGGGLGNLIVDGDDGEGRYAGAGGIAGLAANRGGGGGGGATGGGDGADGDGFSGGGGGGDSTNFMSSTANDKYLFPSSSAGGGAGNNNTPDGDGGNGGGIIDFYSAGDADLTGCTFTTRGQNGQTFDGGGGGGGYTRFVSTGETKNGTFVADGGDGDDTGSGYSGGGGGGGFSFTVSVTFDGTQTLSVTGGTTTGASNGSNGISGSITLTSDQIECLHRQGVW